MAALPAALFPRRPRGLYSLLPNPGRSFGARFPMSFLVIMHDDQSPAGVVEDRLAARGGKIERIFPHHGEALPQAPDGYDGLIVLGGPQHANDDAKHPYLPAVMALMRAFHAEERPVLGSCLGAQLLARAYGGQVRRHTHLEFGFHELSLTPEGKADPLLAGLAPTHTLMEWHEDTFDLPEGATHLLSSEACRNQAFRLGRRAYAFQCHFETTRHMVEKWVGVGRQGLDRHLGDAVPEALARMRGDWTTYGEAQRRFAETVSDRWLDLAAS